MNIKKASEISNVPSATIRYYEKIGLIHPVKRDKNGVRDFDEEDLKWIHFAKTMRGAGLSVEKLTDYLSLFRKGDETVPLRKKLIKDQILELKEKRNALDVALKRLEFKLEHYDDHVNPFEKTLKNEKGQSV